MRKVAIAALAVLALGIVAVPALASHPEVSLPGSNFEIDTDANQKVDDPAPSLDWNNVAEDKKDDLASGQGDNSFGQGAKEDTPVPTVVSGSIPNNKSDLKTFGAYLESAPAGDFLNVYWTRVQEPTGTTNMDFEFNQSETLSANGVTPVRTAGDALIQYDLTSGGTHPELFLSFWVTTGPGSLCEANNATPCWGDRVNLTSSGDATGSINTSAIPAGESGGLGALSARTFGEAQIDFSILQGDDPCNPFASAYLKSRSSDSFTAALKDFIAPATLNFNVCGSIKIIKTDDATPGNPLSGAEFDLLADNAPVGGSPGAEDTFVDDCVTDASGECLFSDLLAGEYWVVETVAPAGHELASPAFQHVTVVGGATTPVTVTFVNPRNRGAILLTKTAKSARDGDAEGNIPLQGVQFTIAGEPVVTDANGQACVDGLLFGAYDVVETTVPDGYAGEDSLTKSVTVDNSATCDDSPYGGETVGFTNTPLTDVSITVDSQVDGGTATVVDCDLNALDGSTAADGDGAPVSSATDLKPQVINCTITIDP
jgi:Prealbumin-like fold domain